MNFWMLLGSISLKREDFRLGDTDYHSSEMVFAKARVKKNLILTFVYVFLFYYCLLFLIIFYVKYNYI